MHSQTLPTWPRFEQRLESQPDERIIHSLWMRLDEVSDAIRRLLEKALGKGK